MSHRSWKLCDVNQLLVQIELYQHHDRYENDAYVLSKHLDEKGLRCKKEPTLKILSFVRLSTVQAKLFINE
ncbi:MAG: adenosylhomocysteinase [Proteobacteria bacterium]|nr:adenosylhomocysteinase [Pseudomonadota bacterium]